MKTPTSPGTGTNTATCRWLLDVSNIHWSAVQLAQKRETALAARSLRLHFDNLFLLLPGGRPGTEGRAVGSMPAPVAAQMRRPSVEVTSLEPGALSGREQGVDETLQVAIYQAAASETTGVATLATGDGAGHHKASGFLPCIQQLRRLGWAIEVIAWAATCNFALRRYAEQEGQFIALEDYYSSITFTGTRPARPLSRGSNQAVRVYKSKVTARAGKDVLWAGDVYTVAVPGIGDLVSFVPPEMLRRSDPASSPARGGQSSREPSAKPPTSESAPAATTTPSAEPTVAGPWVPASGEFVRVAEYTDGVLLLTASVGDKELSIIANAEKRGSELTFKETHIEGAAANEIGSAGLRRVINDFGRANKVSVIIVEGGRRTTGPVIGRRPRMTFRIQ